MAERALSIVIFGAGNIGRSFIGQVFARGGWKVTFVDVDRGLVDALNTARGYRVIVKQQGEPDRALSVEGVSAIDGRDGEAVATAVAQADCLACSVGKPALPKILPGIAAGLVRRAALSAADRRVPPLDLILAENDREAVETVRKGLGPLLPAGFPLGSRLGLVETSIGKMVPIMRKEDLEADRLQVFGEAYNSLIVDRRGFLGPLPAIPDLQPVDEILAWVDRKLFIHNLGHAAVAWLGFAADPEARLIWQALELPGIRDRARAAMREAAVALVLEYPKAHDDASLEAHIEDILSRFANRALGDTVFRVGRDLPRKLDRSDRVVGAALLCQRRGLRWEVIASVFRAALDFRATDEQGLPFPADAAFLDLLGSRGPAFLLSDTCRLDPSDPVDGPVAARLRKECTGGSAAR
jgi:mannitol-1-phosphate 5-dehydrogenase